MTTENSELETKNPATVEYNLKELGSDVQLILRPLPIYICKEISRELQPLLETMNSVSRTATVIVKQIEGVQSRFTNDKIDAETLMKEIAELSEKLQKSTPRDMDERTSTAVISVFTKVLKFYGYARYSEVDVEQKLTLTEIIIILEAQLDLNGPNDFLLTSLRFVMNVIKQAPKDLKELSDKLDTK